VKEKKKPRHIHFVSRRDMGYQHSSLPQGISRMTLCGKVAPDHSILEDEIEDITTTDPRYVTCENCLEFLKDMNEVKSKRGRREKQNGTIV
jgi:hypothetical protein